MTTMPAIHSAAARSIAYLLLVALIVAYLCAPARADTSPTLIALWAWPGVARIAWSGAGCLYRVPAGGTPILIACYPREGSYQVELGSEGPLDGAYHPACDDVWRLWRPDGTVETAPLPCRVYLPTAAR